MIKEFKKIVIENGPVMLVDDSSVDGKVYLQVQQTGGALSVGMNLSLDMLDILRGTIDQYLTHKREAK